MHFFILLLYRFSSFVCSWRKTRNTLYKNILLYFYSSMVTLVWSRTAIGVRERVHIDERVVESRISQQELTSAKILDLIQSKNSTMTHTQCLLFIGHGLHPKIACFSSVTAYTHALLIFLWSRLKTSKYLFLIGCGLHPHHACSLFVIACTNVSLVFR